MSDKKKIPATNNSGVLKMTTSIVSSFVANNAITSDGLPDVINSVHLALSGLAETNGQKREKLKPAVPISRSVTDEYIICLEDGKKLKMLKRYLRSRYDLAPDEYRKRWDLPASYPMVAPSYAARRSEFAKKIGLGRGGRTAAK